MSSKKLKILLAAAEVAPFAKVGGLADVAGALPKALKAMGHDVRVVMPCYKMIETNPDYAAQDLIKSFPVHMADGVVENAFVKQTRIVVGQPGKVYGGKPRPTDVPVYLVGNTPPSRRSPQYHPGYFAHATDSTKVYVYAPEPYVFFNRAILALTRHLSPEWTPDIIHCNDWHTGLVPAYLENDYADTPLADAATLFTIHNLAYQGNFSRETFSVTGLPEELLRMEHLEFYGQWTFMKGGLTFADRVNTVSETYAREIQTEEYGCGLDGLMRSLNSEGKLSGIVNGIDTAVFDPAHDPRVTHHYSAEDISGKALSKAALQKELKLNVDPNVPVIGLVSRLADQKGLDLIHAIADEMMQLDLQFVLLGTGDPNYQKYFKRMNTKYAGKMHASIAFDVDLAQRIYSGSDMFLMPSRFEPCGLGQLISLRYGTVPIVRATGGLADTVHDFDPLGSPDGNGFVFCDYNPQALLQTIKRAVSAFGDKSAWSALVHRALSEDFSWARSAARYEELYLAAAEAHSTKQASDGK